MNRRQAVGAIALTSLAPLPIPASAQSMAPAGRPPTMEKNMLLRISWGQEAVHVKLDANRSAEDLASMLPLTLKLEDYAGTEKIAYLPRNLTTTDAPDGITPRAGDLAYYAPWGNLALFYRDFRHSPGLVRLGRLTTPVDVLRFKVSVEARFEWVQT